MSISTYTFLPLTVDWIQCLQKSVERLSLTSWELDWVPYELHLLGLPAIGGGSPKRESSERSLIYATFQFTFYLPLLFRSKGNISSFAEEEGTV